MSRRIFVLLTAVTAFNLVYNAFLPLHPDEAYYWVWSRHLQVSYFDHPPMIAYLIRLATLLGNSEFVIRLVAVACMSLSTLIMYRLARDLFGERIAQCTAVVFVSLPIVQAQYLVSTPDGPLILFWALTLYCTRIALWDGKLGFLAWTGVSCGLMLLSKYTGALLPAALIIYLLTSRHRYVLCRKEAYFGASLALIAFAPVIIWNAQHDWLSFRFQLARRGGGHVEIGHLADFLAGQALIANPVFLIALLHCVLRDARTSLRDERTAFLAWPYIFTFAFFLWGSLFRASNANWTAPAYITGAILLAHWIEKTGSRWVLHAGVACTVIMVAFTKFPEAFPFLPRQAVLKREFMGYRELFGQGRKYAPAPGSFILSDSYQRASEACYYLGGRSEARTVHAGRVSMYDLWPARYKDAVFFGNEKSVGALHRSYASVEPLAILRFENRFITREVKVYRCRGPLRSTSVGSTKVPNYEKVEAESVRLRADGPAGEQPDSVLPRPAGRRAAGLHRH